MRRWVSQLSTGSYWTLYDSGGATGTCAVGTVVKHVTRWRGFVYGQRSRIQDTAQAAARWVVERLDERAQGAA